jgi:hypothetical protein
MLLRMRLRVTFITPRKGHLLSPVPVGIQYIKLYVIAFRHSLRMPYDNGEPVVYDKETITRTSSISS